MALDAIIKGSGGTNTLGVDANGVASVILRDSDGAEVTAHRNDDIAVKSGVPVMGQFLAGRMARFLRTDSLGNNALLAPTIKFNDPVLVNMSTTTGALYTQSVTTMAATVSGGVKTLNSASTVTTTTGVQEVSNARFQLRPGKPIQWRMHAMPKWGTTAGAGTNGVVDAGFGAPASVTALAVTDGVFFRITASGGLTVVHSIGTAETTLVTLGTFSAGVITSDGSVSGFVSGKSIRVDSYYWWSILLCDEYAVAQIIDPETGDAIFDRVFTVSRTLIGLVQTNYVQCFHRVFNSGAATTACQWLITGVGVEEYDSALGMTWADVAANMQLCNALPTTQVQAANYANSAAPASATLSNSAAGYTTLGGQFQFAAVAGAETDYALFGFTVPTGFRLRVRRIRISTWNMGAAVATTPTTLSWAFSSNAATINLSTGTQFRETIGMQSLAVATAIGGPANQDVEWVGNRITESGRLFIIVLKMPVGTATASQIVRGLINVDHNFE